jgi:predicted RNase H-like HicB family nuclease
MAEEPKALHVNPTGENWEVESEAGTLAQAETKQEAIEAAKEAAAEQNASEILVHTSDGMVESQLRVPPPPRQEPPPSE